MGWLGKLFRRPSIPESFILPGGTSRSSLVPSPDSTKLAYIVVASRGHHVEVNGRSEPTFDAVAGLAFSPDSRAVAYAGCRGGRWFALFGGREYGPYDDIGKTSPLVSPDSAGIAYTARVRNEWFVVRDGERIGGPYEGFSPGGPVFSPDSRKVGYVIKRGQQWAAAVNGDEFPPYPTITQRSWVFSPDSESLAYVAATRLDQQGARWAGEHSVVVNALEQEPWPYDTQGPLGVFPEVYFSPDSQRRAYGVTTSGGFGFVVDGVLQRQYDGLVSGRSDRSEEWALYPGHERAACRREAFTFSPDSRHCAYAMADNRRHKHALVYDGEEMKTHDGILNAPISFSPDSSRIAYGAEDGGAQYVVLDWTPLGRAYGLCLAGNPASFSPDGEHVAYVAMKAPQQYLLCLEFTNWPVPGLPPLGAHIVWEDNQCVHTLVASERQVGVCRYRAGEY